MTGIHQPLFYFPEYVPADVPEELKVFRKALAPPDAPQMERGQHGLVFPTDLSRPIGGAVMAMYLRGLLPAPQDMLTTSEDLRRARGSENNGPEVARLMFSDTPSTLPGGKLVLHEALRKNRMGLFTQYLHHLSLEALDKRDSLGLSALDLAVVLGNEHAVSALLANGAAIVAHQNGMLDGVLQSTNVLELAAHCGALKLLETQLLPYAPQLAPGEREKLLERAGSVAQALSTQALPLQSRAQRHAEFTRISEAFENAEERDGLLGQMAMLLKQGVIIDTIAWGAHGKNRLHGAIAAGASNTMKVLLMLGADVNRAIAAGPSNRPARVDAGLTPLHLLCERSPDLAAVELLLQLGADIDAVSQRGVSVLHYAIQKMNAANRTAMLAIVDTLLAAGIALNKRDENGCTALLHACSDGKWPAAASLIRAGANVEISPDGARHYLKGRSPLHWAAASSDAIDVLELILQNASANFVAQPDTEGATSVALAVLANNTKAIDLLRA